jgi:hypothetical protein
MRKAGLVARMRHEKCINVLIGKPKGKRTFGRYGSRWEDNRMGLKVIGWEGVDWI